MSNLTPNYQFAHASELLAQFASLCMHVVGPVCMHIHTYVGDMFSSSLCLQH